MRPSELSPIFSPRSITVIGASDRKESVGGSILANLINAPFPGSVYPVNLRHDSVQGCKAYASISQLPETPDLAIICTHAVTIPDLVAECGSMGVGGLIVISAGFREMGAEGRVLEARLKGTLREFPRMRMIGPNCLGVLRPSQKLNASFSPVLPQLGRLTLLTQSGALGTAIMDWASGRDIGFAACVSVGNMVNVGIGELIDFFADDDETDALLLYLEGLDEASHFMTAARQCTSKKPIIAYKAGRFEESSKAAASHTGAMTSMDGVYDAAFRRAGIERVHSIEELFDCARLLSGQRRAWGDRLAIITNAGGPGIMATDAWLSLGGTLAKLSDQTITKLGQALPPCWSHGNPIDVLGDASVERFQVAMSLALQDPSVDGLMVIVTPQTMTEPGRIATAVAAAQRESSKTIVASWIGGPAVELGRKILRSHGIPVYDYPEAAANALRHLVSAGHLQNGLSSTDHFWPTSTNKISTDRIACWHRKLAEVHGLVDEVTSKELLADYGIPIVPSKVAQSADEAVALAEQLQFPVAMKVLSPEISHKTDVGGVLLNLATSQAVRSGYQTIKDSVRERRPDARFLGVSVQPMVSASRGIELLLGMKRDPLFGPVFLLGAGGVTAELQKDSVLELAPFDDVIWSHFLHSLRLYPLLEGYRGRPGVDLAQLRDIMLRFVQFGCEFSELSAAEINPLLITPTTITALDARLITDSSNSKT